MAYKIFINPSARLDIIEAIDWYNKQQTNLGFRFYKDIQSTLDNIQKNPSGFAVRYKTIRTAIVKKFPYMIHYIMDRQSETISVLAIICMYRDPELWIEKQ
ncbi:MAG: type II toxin-antitoxin system RelE/ParE family toxin [Prolixibacteraceae bacterium]